MEAAHKKKRNNRMDSQLFWVLGVMIVVIVVFFVASHFLNGSRTVEYEGLTFTKVMFGEIPLYQYVYDTPSFARAANGKYIQTGHRQAAILLRTNPKDLDVVPVEGTIHYPQRESKIYITFSSEGLDCNYSTIGAAELSSFLSQNSYQFEAGYSDPLYAKEKNSTYITCAEHPNNMVINVKGGENSEIVIDGGCHTLSVSNCEVLPVVEKFIVQSIVDAKNTNSSSSG